MAADPLQIEGLADTHDGITQPRTAGTRGLRIWIINHYAKQPNDSGGLRHWHLARKLVKEGHKPVIIASGFRHRGIGGERLTKGARVGLQEWEGVKYIWLRTPSYKGNSARRLWNMISFSLGVLVNRRVRELPAPDVVIGSSPHLFAALAAHRWAQRLRVPFVLEVRDLWPDSLIQVAGVSPWHPLVLLLRRVEKFLYRGADRIISLLPSADDHFRRMAPHAEVAWIPNGTDLDYRFPAASNRSRDLFHVLYAGSHGPANALDCMIEAARIVERRGFGDQILFRFIGSGPEKSRLIDQVRDAGQTNVRFEDPVPKHGMSRVLQDADVLMGSTLDLDLYKFGISPNKLIDYLASGRPIVWGTAASNDPVSEAGAGMTVAAEDSSGIADAVLALFEMSEEGRQQMGNRGRAYATRVHSYETLASKLSRLLMEVATSENTDGRHG